MSKLAGYRLGIDVGGTNTDAVILDPQLRCIAKIKVPTSADVYQDIEQALRQVLALAAIDPGAIKYAMLGTTQCTNAIVERKGLDRVGYLRISLPSSDGVPPLADWDDEWHQLLGAHFYQVHGGYEFNGREIHALDEQEVRQYCRQMRGAVDSLAICGVFSPVDNRQELQVAEWVASELPGLPISLSHQVGSIGLLERENAIILNAALQSTAARFVDGFTRSLQENGIPATPFFGQNDGTLMSAELVKRYPILTLACGPTNSIRGASHLSGLTDALVIDVGGTTTDIGVLVNGFPRESALAVKIGTVRTNFRMPDIAAIGIGGGTCVYHTEESDVQVGPQSVGHRLLEQGISFGGSTLTLTDVLLQTERYQWPDSQQLKPTSVDTRLCERAYQEMCRMVEETIDKMKTSAQPIPAILVGGGSILIPDQLAGISHTVRPENFDAANAIGVALGKVSGQVEKVVSFAGQQRQLLQQTLQQEAIDAAINAGAHPASVELIEYLEVPLAYLPGNAMLVKIKAAGDLS
ncbi:MAG: hydantoinase/oxoprolinase N-terminal domain-containing protein [Enterobacteriaceae bacterium]